MLSSCQSPYRHSWRRYRWWHALSIVMFIAYPVLFVALANLFPRMLAGGAAVFVPFFLYAGSWIAVSNMARRWKRPRCGELFFGTLGVPQLPMVFIRACRSCGLPKYAAADPDAQPNA